MRIVERLRFWLRGLFQGRSVESEMEKEMRLHLDLEIENNVRLGMSPDAARRAALVAFGGVESAKDAVRDERPLRWLEHTVGDARFAMRGFARRPGYTAAIVLLIALGVGANAAIFSVINHVMLRPIPFRDGNRMVEFVTTSNNGLVLITPLRADIDTWRARQHAVERIALIREDPFELGDSTRGAVENVSGVLITPGTSALVGMHPILGRDLVPSDTLSDAPLVVLLSHGLWERRFGGVSEIVGRSIWLNGQLHRVIGVMPKGFGVPFAEGAQVFTALRSAGPNQPIMAIGKLREGVGIDDANRELALIADQGRAADASTQTPSRLRVPELKRAVDMVGKRLQRMLLLLFGAVCAVLLIACANVTNLFMAHAWSRQREFAIRSALGAGRGRLVRQVITESVLLSLIGGMCGLGVAVSAIRVIAVAQPKFTELQGAHADGTVMSWGLSIALLTGLLFSVAPALFVADRRVGESLKAGARAAGTSHTARRVRAMLVITEIALSVVLLTGAGLLVRTLRAMQRTSVGIQADGLSGIVVRLTDPKLSDDVARRAAMAAILANVRNVPGVQGAALAMSLPPGFALGLAGVQIEGRTLSADDSIAASSVNMATPDLFRISGIHLLTGRVFAEDKSNSVGFTADEVIVNESFAKRFWPAGDALGHRVKAGPTWATIVGIANDVRVPGKDRPSDQIQIYARMPGAARFGTVVVRSTLPMVTIVPEITRAIRRASPFVKIGDAQSADAIISEARSAQRLVLTLLAAFAALALVITAFGLHAVIAYAVSQRTREIGVRVALGAQSADVSRLVFGQGLALTASGLTIGVAAAMAATRSLRGMLYGVQPGDPATITAVAIVLGFVALAASFTPARRAMRIDPIDALKSE